MKLAIARPRRPLTTNFPKQRQACDSKKKVESHGLWLWEVVNGLVSIFTFQIKEKLFGMCFGLQAKGR